MHIFISCTWFWYGLSFLNVSLCVIYDFIWARLLFHARFLRITCLHSRSLLVFMWASLCFMWDLNEMNNKVQIDMLPSWESNGKRTGEPLIQHPYRIQNQHPWTRITTIELPLGTNCYTNPNHFFEAFLLIEYREEHICAATYFIF